MATGPDIFQNCYTMLEQDIMNGEACIMYPGEYTSSIGRV